MRGRPTKFKPEYIQLAKKACEVMGATNQELAEFLEVNIATLNRWKMENKAFRDAIKVGKAVADQRVEISLYARAMGYSVPETKVFCSGGEVTEVEVMHHYPPETVACIFWLKNRKPEAWRDAKDIVVHQPLSDKERLERLDVILMGALQRADAIDVDTPLQ